MDNITKTIANNLQAIRKERLLTLQDLADITGVSKSMLGEIERGASNPTINVVWKIANGLKLPISTLIHEPAPSYSLVKKADRKTIDKGTYTMSLIFECMHDRNFEVHHVEFLPHLTHESAGHSRGVMEYTMVYEGTLVITVDGKSFELDEGDSFIFDAEKPHTYSALGESPAKAHSLIYYPN